MEGGPNIQEAENYSSSEALEKQLSGCAFHCCDPRGKFHRFLALLFMCFLGFGKFKN